MKKLLSVILAGALALTAVSPAFAATDSYVAQTNRVYCGVDFANATGVAAGGDLSEYLNTASNGEFGWNGNGSTATITKAEDDLMGTVAKIKPGTTGTAQLQLLKGAWKNGAADGTNKTGTMFEFNFKVTNPTAKVRLNSKTELGDGHHMFEFYPDGTMSFRVVDQAKAVAAYNVGEWNHMVIEFCPHYWRVGSAAAEMRVWINGKELGMASASKGTPYFASESWTGTWFEFDPDATGESEILLANLAKYDGPTNVRYSPASAGNALVAVTSTSEDVTVDATTKAINYAEGVTTDDLVAALTGADTFYIATAEDVEKDTEMFTEDDYPIADLTNIITVSDSGDAFNYYSVAPMEALEISVGGKLTADHDARTISGSVVDYPTVADVKNDIEVTAGNPDYVVYAGSEVAEDTADATTITSIAFESETGAVKKTYTVAIRTAERVFWNIDFKDYASSGATSATDFADNDGVRVRIMGGSVFETVVDEQLGHEVGHITPSTSWAGFDDPLYWDCDVTADDYVIFETVMKVAEVGVAGNPDLPLNNQNYKAWDFGNGSARSTIATFNGSTAEAYEADKWYHIVVQMKDGYPIYTWINGEPASNTYWPRSCSQVDVANFWSKVTALTAGNNGDASPLGFRGKAEWWLKKYALYRSNVPYDEVANGDVAKLTSVDGLSVEDSLKVVMYDDDEMTVADFVDTIGKPEGATVIVYSDGDVLAEDDILADATSVFVRSASTNRVETYSLVSASAAMPSVEWDTSDAKLTVDGTAISFKEADIRTVADLKAKATLGDGTTLTVKDANGNTLADNASSTGIAKVVASKGGYEIDYTVTVTAATKTYVNYDWYVSDTNMGSGGTPLKLAHAKQMTQVMDDDMGYTVAHITWTGSTWGGLVTNGANTVGADLVDGDKFIIETTIKVDACNVPSNPLLTLGGGSGSANANQDVFDFGYYGARPTINLLGGKTTVPYEAGKWYHIVAEYTTTDAAGSTVNMWVNGTQYVTNHTIAALTPTQLNTYMNTNERMRLMQPGTSDEANRQTYSLAQYSWYKSEFGYDAAAQAKDAATITVAGDALTYDAVNNCFIGTDTTLTVEGLKTALTVPAGATVKYLDANGNEVADGELAKTVKSIVSVSEQKTQAMRYAVSIATQDTSSEAYNVNYADMTINGVLQQTTADVFKANITVDGDYTFNSTGKYVADGDTVVTANNTFTVKLAHIYHATGAKVLSGAGEDGLHLGLKTGVITESLVTGDAVRGDYVQYTGAEGGNFWRLNFRAEDTSNNGSGYPALQEGEVKNIEFAVKSDSGAHWGLIFNGTWTINGDGELLALNQGMTNGYHLAQSYRLGEWMHVAVSVLGTPSGELLKQRVYIDGEFVFEGGLSTTNHNAGIGLWLADGLMAGEDFAIDDIKIWDSAIWGIDMEYYYGEVTSTSDDVVVANGEVWLANGAKVSDGISVAAIDKTGAAVDLSTLAAGDMFYVKQGPIVKPFTVREGALGVTVAEDGTLTANVGMVKDCDKAAIFVAGVHDDGKFSNIFKIVKAATALRSFNTADTITYDLNNIGATNAKVYIWDASLRTLCDVAEFVCADGVWSAK